MLEWDQLWNKLKENYYQNNNQWTETTKSMFYEMLGVLPPEFMKNGLFVVGEAWKHDNDGFPVFATFKQKNNQFFAKYATLKQAKEEADQI